MNFIKSLEYIKENKEKTINEMVAFIDADTILFCEKKQTKQQDKWQSLLQILAEKYGIKAQISYDLLPADNSYAKQKYGNILQQMSDKELTSCVLYSGILKSVLLALLLVKKEISVTEAFANAFWEELQQNEQWGIDAQAEEKRKEALQMLYKIEEFERG